MMKSVKSYAKINISLLVKEKRPDGYHELDSLMVPIELHDSIVISPLYNRDDSFVTVDDFSNGLIHYNLAGSAIDTLEKRYGVHKSFRVYIHKNIPMQAGLGGGSSNAAFTLKAINQILKLGASDEELIELAAPLGADIPFFIKCTPSRCGGIGEKMQPLEIKNNYHVLIVKPTEGVSTKECFKLLDSRPYPEVDIEKVVEALRDGDDEKLAKYMGNSLQPSAIEIVPEIKAIIDYLKEQGLKLVQMSGSGSSVFAMSTDKSKLKRVQKQIDEEGKWFSELTRIIK